MKIADLRIVYLRETPDESNVAPDRGRQRRIGGAAAPVDPDDCAARIPGRPRPLGARGVDRPAP